MPRRKPGHRKLRHGARALEQLMKTQKLDMHPTVARMIRSVENDLAADYGGWARVSTARAILIRKAAWLTLITDSLEHFVGRQGGPLTAEGDLLGAVARPHYLAHVNALGRLLETLGLDRADVEPLTLAEYLATRTVGQNRPPDGQRSPSSDERPADVVADPPVPTGATEAE